MNKLEECRLKIDAIDNEIIRLYEERMKAVKEYRLLCSSIVLKKYWWWILPSD